MTATEPRPPLVEVDNLSVEYQQRHRQKLRAVSGIDLEVARGGTLGIVGESGSGKSTVGAAILGFTPVATGSIRFEGRDITTVRGAQRRALTRDIQIVFQDPYNSLNPTRTIGQTLGEPLRYNLGLSAQDTRSRVAGLLTRVGLPPDAAGKYPNAFSGGQRQRIAIARALAPEPKLIICDEPVSALDLSVQAQVLNLLRDLQIDTGVAYIFISHDLAVVRHMADEIAVMQRGHIVERGPAADVYDAPKHPYTRALLTAAPLPDPQAQARRRQERRALAAT